MSDIVRKLLSNSFVLFVIFIVIAIIIPLPSWLMDFMILLNISLSLIILVMTMFIKEALEFSVFPTVLLLTTVLRLSLNVSTTRGILSRGYAGEVISAFGNFVMGGDAIVGFLIFIIIVLVNFIVITKGSERVSEVAARFTLDAPALFGDWSGNDMADAIAAAEKKMAEENKQDIPLVNPDSGSDPFGGVFDVSDNHDDMSGFDMDTHTEEPEQVDEIKPLDVSDHSEASFNNDFSKDLLAQTMPASALTDADDDLLAAVRAAEEAAAIKPNNVSDIDMDEQPESSGSEEDDLMKALREAEAAFGGTSFHDAADEEPEEDTSAAADPWAELQNQLKAMESANGASSAITYDAPEPQEENQPEEQSTTPPSADDSSIWDFGGGNSGSGSDDDDMSSDFGGFGGF